MTYSEAQQIIEDADNYYQMRSECSAEAGMGAVSLGYDGYDGVSEWNELHPEDPQVARDLVAAAAYLRNFPLKLIYMNDKFMDAWVLATSYAPVDNDDIPF